MAQQVIAGRMFASLTDAERLRQLAQNVALALQGVDRSNDRRSLDGQKERLARMFAALSATNEAIMRAQTRAQMFQQVCDAAAHGGNFASTIIGLAEPGEDFLRIVATAGPDAETSRTARVAVTTAHLEGLGPSGTAFRTRQPCVSNDYLADERGAAFHDRARALGGKSCAALPLLSHGEAVGVLVFLATERDTFTPELVKLLQRLAENVSFAIENFDRADSRRLADEQKERITRMFAALSATNKAVLQARNADEMFQMVCDAATGPGKLLGASISLHDPKSSWFTRVACSGELAHIYDKVTISADPNLPEGQSLSGGVFRTGNPCFVDDVANDPRSARWRSDLLAHGVRAGAVLPLVKNGEIVGVFSSFFGEESGPLDDEQIQLTTRVAENISFGLELFERQKQKDSLTRMFAALGATNEAIMRARTRNELFELVCEAAAKGGNFTATAIGLAEPGNDFLRISASAGPTVATSKHARLAINADLPEGRGLSGAAFRTLRPCVSNDYLAEIKEKVLLETIQREGTQSGAALPLLIRGQAIGVLVFMSSERGAFTPELVELLQRLADNISFALENFDRADERRMAEYQKDCLASMFAALSATNEAIMRAQTRDELFRLVCEAAAQGGRFTSTVVALAQPGSEFLRIAATAGPNAEVSKTLILATTRERPEGRGLSGTAFRTRQVCVSNDFLADERTAAFHEHARARGDKSCAALPLLSRGEVVGVLLIMSCELGVFTPELVELLQRLADNVSFALENFDRADERRMADQQKERLTRMYTALSATNEAIMRAETRNELFKLVCEAAVNGGNFVEASIALAEPGSDFLRKVATAGPGSAAAGTIRMAITASYPEGRGMSGEAFRTRRPCISNDYLADARGAAFHGSARARGVKSLAALPLLSHDQAVGVLIFLSNEQGAFTPELVELLQRLSENVSFALDNFDRADERRQAREKEERLSRMYAALSATNEAIMRAGTRAELFQLVCEAAVRGGRFASTIIALSEPGSDFLRVCAWAGPKGEMQRSVRIAITDAYPEGRGLSGTAFRTSQPCIINDYLADERGAAFYERALREGNKSGAALPLLSRDQVAGILVFMSSEREAFTPELVELLLRLANNVSFALNNFDRADEKAKADERIKYLATHDGLTDLPNRAMFNNLLHSAIEAARLNNRKFAVLFTDIDRFKVINDSLGHDAGDAMLVEIGNRLRQCLRDGDVVARLGGDEFVVILQQAAQPRQVEATARKLLSVVSEPLQLCGLECRATASIGVAMFPDDGEDELTLTKNADMAMYRAKEEGKNGFRFFTKQNKMQSVERLVFESRLRQALDRNEFSLHYQAKVDSIDQITGVEALLRWTLPDLGELSPLQFIPIAEETGLIVPIGRWVLNKACAQNMAWRRQGLPALSMAVNLSPRQFSDENLLQDIDDALAASGMPAELLQLEITESMVMHNVGRTIELLDIIRSRGVRLAIDDFGTGYSSMSLMKKLPFDTIKIDRSFVKDLPQDSEDRAIAQAIISMGKALGLSVVAEGVETAEQAAFLREHGCDEMQGYLFSRPAPAERMPEILCANRRAATPLQSLNAIGASTPKSREAGRLLLAPQRKRSKSDGAAARDIAARLP